MCHLNRPEGRWVIDGTELGITPLTTKVEQKKTIQWCLPKKDSKIISPG
ncbi:MAG: hypothetical protein K0S58_3044 [Nitrospira sp.]|nr:hypothetical protein [Nitrospira sp.]